MNNLNYVLLEGHLVRDPSFRLLNPQLRLCTFSIGNNRKCKKGDSYVDDTSFILIETWGSLADFCEKNLKKGSGVRLIGRIKQFVSDNSKTGIREKVYVIAEHIEFMPKPASQTEPSEDVVSVIDQTPENLQTTKEVEDTLNNNVADEEPVDEKPEQ